ncbi:SOS response-associated peptidase [Myxococcota bacterium]|nr:SOS response-associated peptidase [Myxococcota bacterium]
MCGRFALNATAADLVSFFALLETPEDPPPRYNIAPSQQVLVVRAEREGSRASRRLVPLHWGLVPSWSRGAWDEVRKQSYRLLNARAETIFEKPSFRQAIARRRCLVPTNGFYEWGAPPAGWRRGTPKPATLIARPDRGLIALGGIWERWQGPDGPVESVAIVTTAANDTVAPLHDRMPVIVPPAAMAAWLDPAVQDPAQVAAWLQPEPPGLLALTPVGPAVNDARHDSARCWDPPQPA